MVAFIIGLLLGFIFGAMSLIVVAMLYNDQNK